ncbi:hypothetical protein FKM82_030786 [Ascaphus truei]
MSAGHRRSEQPEEAQRWGQHLVSGERRSTRSGDQWPSPGMPLVLPDLVEPAPAGGIGMAGRGMWQLAYAP